MAKVYGVRVGMQTGKFFSWDEVKPLVTGYPGAQFKGFPTEAEVDEYLAFVPNGVSVPSPAAPPVPEVKTEEPEAPVKKKRKKKSDIPDDADTKKFIQESLDHTNKVIAYVDGSNNKDIPAYSYGAIFFLRGEKLTFKKAGDDPRLIDLWNVAGEMSGAVKAVRFCQENDIKELDLYYDYNGIQAWAEDEWKAKTPGTQAYKNFMLKSRQEIKIHFHKVKGHTGVELNEEADRLAKAAIAEFKKEREKSA